VTGATLPVPIIRPHADMAGRISNPTHGRHVETPVSGRPEPNIVMTSDQVLLVRSTWPLIAERSDELSARFYDRLFAMDDSAARLFAGVDMTAQRAKLIHTLGFVVKVLDDVDCLLPAVAALGKRHAHYGVEHRHFDSVGDALLLAYADTLGPAFTPQLREAWAAAYAFIASVMRRALVRGGERDALESSPSSQT
jgi:hemoglobin-like flavoprotein